MPGLLSTLTASPASPSRPAGPRGPGRGPGRCESEPGGVPTCIRVGCFPAGLDELSSVPVFKVHPALVMLVLVTQEHQVPRGVLLPAGQEIGPFWLSLSNLRRHRSWCARASNRWSRYSAAAYPSSAGTQGRRECDSSHAREQRGTAPSNGRRNWRLTGVATGTLSRAGLRPQAADVAAGGAHGACCTAIVSRAGDVRRCRTGRGLRGACSPRCRAPRRARPFGVACARLTQSARWCRRPLR